MRTLLFINALETYIKDHYIGLLVIFRTRNTKEDDNNEELKKRLYAECKGDVIDATAIE